MEESKTSWKKKAANAGIDFGIALASGVGAIHVLRKAPANFEKFTGWVMLAAGVAGYFFGGSLVKTAAVVVGTVGFIGGMNSLTKENGVPAIEGWKGTVNKIIPQINSGLEGISFAGLGNTQVQNFNEKLLGEGMQEDLLHGLGEGASTIAENLLGAQ